MSIWVLPIVLIIGILSLIGLGFYLGNDLQENGEPLEHIE